MISLTLFLVALAGLCFGSFVTLASYRLPRGEPVACGRSRCPHCNTALAARDLFPVLSWLIRAGRCRHCHVALSPRYPLIELATAALFLVIYHTHGLTALSLLLMLASVALMVMVVTDLEHGIIPDQVHIALLALGLMHQFMAGQSPEGITLGFIVALAVGLTLHHGYYWVRGREGLGYGDVKFLAVAGVWLGVLPLPPFLFMAGLLGVATGLLWRLLGRGDIFPFAPALALSLWVSITYPEIINRLLYMINI